MALGECTVSTSRLKDIKHEREGEVEVKVRRERNSMTVELDKGEPGIVSLGE